MRVHSLDALSRLPACLRAGVQNPVAWLLFLVPVTASPATIDLSVPPRVGIGAWNLASDFDFDADGTPDVAVTGDSSVSIYRTLPRGDLALLGKFDIHGVNGRVNLNDVMDLDADGFPELFVGWSRLSANCIVGPLRLLWNDNNQTGEQVSLPSFYDSRVVAADLDGDGDLDLVISSKYCNPGNVDEGYLDVFIRDGERSFAPAVRYFEHGPSPGPIAIADFTGDGRPDIVAASLCKVLPNLGGGVLGPPADFDTRQPTSFLSTADINGDGWPDITTSTDRGLRVYRNNRLGGFSRSDVTTSVGLIPQVHDLDFDGDTDFVLTTEFEVRILRNRGTGSFDAFEFPLPRVDRADPALVGDFNNDDRLDVLANRRQLVLSTGDGYALGRRVGLPNAQGGVRGIDWDGDGNLDLVTQRNAAEANLVRGLGDGDLVVAWPVDLGGEPWLAADFNRDRLTDLLVAYSDEVWLLLGKPAEGFTMGPRTAFPIRNASRRDVAMADFNKDAIPDVAIAVTVQNGGGLGVFLSAAGAPLASAQTQASGTSPHAVVAGDFDGDGWVDLACNGWQAFLLVLYNDGGTFLPPVFLAAETPGDLAAADFDADGRSDLVLVTDHGQLQLWYGAQRGAFDEVTLASGDGDVVYAGNLDADGAPDVAAAVGSEVAVFLNQGQRNFGAARRTNMSTLPAALAAGDLDNDDLVDLVAFGRFPDTQHGFTILRNLGGGDFAAISSDNSGANHGVFLDWTHDGMLDLLTGLSVLYVNRTDTETSVTLVDLSAAWRDGAIVLEWTLADVPPGSTLEVLRSPEQAGPYAVAGRVVHPAPSREWFADTAVDPSSEYWYRIVLVLPQGQRQVLAEIHVARPGRESPGLQAIENTGGRTVRIRYAVTKSRDPVSLDVFDVRGRRVRTLVQGQRSQGTHVVLWDGTDERRVLAARGVYFVRFTAGALRQARQFVLQ